jgi:hypothetical protein
VDIFTALDRPSSYLGREIKYDQNGSHGVPINGFDHKRYLELNPDVAAAGVDAWEHFNTFGKAENRPW